MLLIDGVKYELWTPPNEDEFERVVKEHAQDIFGEQAIYLDIKQKLKSGSGIGSIPDGYAILLGNLPQWHIIEVELSSHPLHEHIVSQVSRFINGISNLGRRTEIVNAIYSEVNGNDFLKLKVKQAIGQVEVYKFLYDLISTPPILTVIIEKDTEGLREAIATLAHPQIKVVAFQTFVREEVGLAVHAHLFEPLYQASTPKATIVSEQHVAPTVPIPQDTLEVTVRNPSCIRFHLFSIPKPRRSFFPGFKIPFELETDTGIIKTWVTSAPAGTEIGDPNAGAYIQANLAEWYRQHPTIKVGDRLHLKVIEPMKKYRLELLK